MTAKEMEAQLLAKKLNRPIYINRYKCQGTDYGQEIQVCETGPTTLCCGIALPDGTIEKVVQSMFIRPTRSEQC